MRAALAAHDTEGVLAAVPLPTFTAALEAVLPELDELAHAAHGVSSTALGYAVPYTDVSDEVITAIRRDAAELVAEVSDETKDAIRQAIERGYTSGRGMRQAAREIEQMVGLTTTQEATLERIRAHASAEQEIEQRAAAMRTERARTIARTEANAAMNRGNRAAWRDAVAKGLIDAHAYQREWLTVLPAPGVCEVCEPLDQKRAPIHGVYVDGSDGPPAHPNCRCTEVLVPTTT